MTRSPFEPIVDLLERIIYYSSDEMIMRLGDINRSDLILQMPQFLINHIPEAVSSKYGFLGHSVNGQVKLFEGIEIHPSTDLAITLFHKDYPLRNENWMIVKIPLAPAHKIVDERYEKFVLELQECNYFKFNANVINN